MINYVHSSVSSVFGQVWLVGWDSLFSNQPRFCVKASDDPFLTRYMTIDKVPDCIGVMKFERVKEGDENEEKEVDLEDWYPWNDIRMVFHIIVLCPNVHAKTWISIDPCIKDDSGERERRGLIGVDIKRLYSVNIINSFRGIRHSSFVTTESDAIWNMFHPHPVSFMCLCKLFHLRKYTIRLWCFPNLEGWTCLLKWP